MTDTNHFEVDVSEGRPPMVAIALGEKLLTSEVTALAAQVESQVAALSGNPFTLLIDTRAVRGAEPGATEAMQALENTLATKGLLKLAHVVTSTEVGARLEAAYAAMGVPNLIGTFVEVDAAKQFLESARAEA